MKEQTNKSNANEALMGLIVTLLGAVYLILTVNVKDAAVGNPMEPKFFPFIISGMLIILGLYFLLKTGPSQIKVAMNNVKKALSDEPDIYQTIGFTALNCVVYGLLFKRIGYVLSTVIFLHVMLYLTRGKKWKSHTIIAVAFSLSIYLIFSKLLGVTLPKMPFINF